LNLFYTPDISGSLYALYEEESRHCQKVLRLREGDTVHLTDGKGTLFEARISDLRSRRVTVEIISRQENYNKRNYFLHLAVAPTKNIDRYEWFLEKATEIGVDEITPLICDHSERRHLRTDRLDKIIISAMKQSIKAFHPKLNEPIHLSKFLASQSPSFPASPPTRLPANPLPENKYMAYITSNAPLLQQSYQKGAAAAILIGPEGDFSPAEAEAAVKSGYQVISLGESRLRTETAAIVACHTIHLLNQ
jgi:16S rRNA (uracil1498-N3)-methyltransferase